MRKTLDTLKEEWAKADSWRGKAMVITIMPLVVGVMAIIPPAYDCPSCGTELVGTGNNCPECGYAFTEMGELRRLNEQISDAKDGMENE